MQSRKGQSIEDASMQVIEREIGSHSYNKKEWPIVRRVIHSTADFDFAMENSIIFHKEAIENGLKALKSGCNIVVDVNGVAGLLNKQNTKKFGNNVICRISDPEITHQVQESNKTRSQMSMRISSSDIDEGLVVIGNAPTALLEVIQMVKEGITRPALIVGLPVGFISAAESKEKLRKVDIPFITNKGRKGGSPSAASIVNALFKMIE